MDFGNTVGAPNLSPRPYRTVPYRFETYHFLDLDSKNRGTVAKNRSILYGKAFTL